MHQEMYWPCNLCLLCLRLGMQETSVSNLTVICVLGRSRCPYTMYDLGISDIQLSVFTSIILHGHKILPSSVSLTECSSCLNTDVCLHGLPPRPRSLLPNALVDPNGIDRFGKWHIHGDMYTCGKGSSGMLHSLERINIPIWPKFAFPIITYQMIKGWHSNFLMS